MSLTQDPYQAGLARLKELAEEPVSGRNEDTTRFQLVDVLLTECLGHPRSSITTEEHAHPGFADYIVSAPGRLLVIEAKRETVSFTLPEGLAGRPTVSVASLRSDPVTRATIDQVIPYAQRLGIPLAAIANGHQLAVFLGSRTDGKDIESGEALVFVSLQDMVEQYRKLWDLLSRDALVERRAVQVLLMGSAHPQPPTKLSSTIPNYPGFRPRTEQDTDLKILSTIFIQDIEGNAEVSDEFLRECYYNSGTLSQYAFISKEILKSRYKSLPAAIGIETEPLRGKKGLSPSFHGDLIAAAVTSKPIVLLGDVGVGKTMFIRHLLRVEASDELARSLVFYVDFAREPALQSALQEHIVDSIVEQLEGDYGYELFENKFVRAIYNSELNKFRRGIHGPLRDTNPERFAELEIEELVKLTADRSRHLEKALRHLDATAGRKTVIVLDNIDQRSREFQDQVFVIAQALSASLRATVFVSLRPSTFFDSKLRGSLAAYQPRAFHVAPPRVSEVVRKRLKFARTQLEQERESSSALSLNSGDLSAYLDALDAGFASNNSLVEFLENMSGGNIRLALEYLSAFIGSGYVDTQRILTVAAAGDTYTIPVHEFIRAIVNGENDLYDPRSSRIVNIFDVCIGDSREHFLMPLLLAHLHAEGESKGTDGFVSGEELYPTAQSWGFLPEQIKWHLDRGVTHGLIETDPGKEEAGPYRVSSIGAYMQKQMVTLFSYVDAMIVDTPIFDPTFRSEILDVRAIEGRLDRATAFKDYLDKIWELFPSPESLSFDWNIQGARLHADIEEARFKAIRARNRR
ncbi:P-loop NTPase fold protein [Leifsonia sp. McL0607]|uniref:P-loop NTPase fold protein n=1 Tax=Leifsonia sp. McL0607 TaxID=3415672 RepID=UPI003CE6AB09